MPDPRNLLQQVFTRLAELGRSSAGMPEGAQCGRHPSGTEIPHPASKLIYSSLPVPRGVRRA